MDTKIQNLRRAAASGDDEAAIRLSIEMDRLRPKMKPVISIKRESLENGIFTWIRITRIKLNSDGKITDWHTKRRPMSNHDYYWTQRPETRPHGY